jgi:hypothetical protein
MRYRRTLASIGMQLPRLCQVERKRSVGIEAFMSWTSASTVRLKLRVNGHQKKTMQGRKDWNAIASHFSGRTRHQYSKRWLTRLDSNCATRSTRLRGKVRTTSSKKRKEESESDFDSVSAIESAIDSRRPTRQTRITRAAPLENTNS